ncbi:MAG TPA: RNA methyltransferase [Clostridiales bacterium]|nr:RNA methyltransferase [Clostridiales bacterium]HPV01160.1 RNA methyltransferase [Clostridiales bacterium]
MIRITSSKNPVVKEIRSLRDKSGRNEKGLYFIEGARFVSEALNGLGTTGGPGSVHGSAVHGTNGSTAPGMQDISQPDIRYIAVSDSFVSGAGYERTVKPCLERGIKVYSLPDSLFESVSDTMNPQGILAVMGMKKKSLEGAEIRDGILVILDGVRDPGNMGTIIRTADAAGCAGIIVTEGCVDLYNPKVLRSTMGSVFHLPVLHCGSTTEAVDICRKKGFLVCATHMEGSVSIYDADLSGNVAFVIGSEADGVSDDVLDNSDMLVRIPMAGRAESLNAAVAAAVIIYEAVRQRTYGKGAL